MSEDHGHPFLKLVAVSAALFAGYNAFLSLQRVSRYETLFFQQSKESVADLMGRASSRVDCAAVLPNVSVQAEAFCQQPKVSDVLAFNMCMVEFFCPPVVQAAFDQEGKLLYKFNERDAKR